MKFMATRSCMHLLPTLGVQHVVADITNFSDGELQVSIRKELENQSIYVLAATPTPADNWLELFLVLDALQRVGARVSLFLTYCGYTRQDTARPGQPLSSEMLFRFLRTFSIQKTTIVHIHNPRLRLFFDFTDLILLDFFVPLANQVDCIVAPDHGAVAVATNIAAVAKKELVVMHKQRESPDKSLQMRFDGDCANKRVLLVDDMIATGGTIISAAEIAQEHGARDVYVAATHGIFANDALERIERSCIKQVFVTNTLQQQCKRSWLRIIDCTPMIRPFFEIA